MVVKFCGFRVYLFGCVLHTATSSTIQTNGVEGCNKTEDLCGDHQTCVNLDGTYNCSCVQAFRQRAGGNMKCISKSPGFPIQFPAEVIVGITLLIWILSCLVVVAVVVKSFKGCSSQKKGNSTMARSTGPTQDQMVNYDTLQVWDDSQNNTNYTSLSGVTPSVYSEANDITSSYMDVIGENTTGGCSFVNGNLDNTTNYVNS